jgi:ABC-type nitrate/sulfonate/bicarbonate transport system permease component
MISRYRNPLTTALLVVLILLFWEAAVRWFSLPAIILPSPSAIAIYLYENFPKLVGHAWVTTYEILVGFSIGAVLGIFIAQAMMEFPLLRGSVYPLVIASQTIPKIAIAPLLIIWFGVGLAPKLITVALLALFPVLINTVVGFESADRGHLDLMRSVHAGKRQIYWNIYFPTALPYIFAGLKLAITVSVIGALVGEWVASTKGLGYLLLFYTQYLDMVATFAVLIVLVVLGVALFSIIAQAERAVSWESRVRSKSRVETAEANL